MLVLFKMYTCMKELLLDDFITFRLLCLTNQLSRQSTKLIAAHSNLRLPEWRCLAILGAHGPQQVSEITARLQSDKGLVSRSLSGLVKKGCVETKCGSDDRRRTIVSLTTKGMSTVKRMMPIMQQRQTKLIDAVTKKERLMLYKVISKLQIASTLADEEIASKVPLR